jgi:hypothetical protein
MLTRILIMGVFLLLFYSGFSQSPIRSKLIDLNKKIRTIISEQDTVLMEERETEFVQLFIKIDSAGMLRSILPMGSDKDTLYKIFKNMKPDQFKDWKCVECRNKIVIIPYFYFSGNIRNKNYLDLIFVDYYLKIPSKNLITTSGNVIYLKWLSLTAPQNLHRGY